MVLKHRQPVSAKIPYFLKIPQILCERTDARAVQAARAAVYVEFMTVKIYF